MHAFRAQRNRKEKEVSRALLYFKHWRVRERAEVVEEKMSIAVMLMGELREKKAATTMTTGQWKAQEGISIANTRLQLLLNSHLAS